MTALDVNISGRVQWIYQGDLDRFFGPLDALDVTGWRLRVFLQHVQVEGWFGQGLSLLDGRRFNPSNLNSHKGEQVNVELQLLARIRKRVPAQPDTLVLPNAQRPSAEEVLQSLAHGLLLRDPASDTVWRIAWISPKRTVTVLRSASATVERRAMELVQALLTGRLTRVDPVRSDALLARHLAK